MTKMTTADRLREELSYLRSIFINQGSSPETARRMEAIRAELSKAQRRRIVARARREFLYDMNGHHGPA